MPMTSWMTASATASLRKGVQFQGGYGEMTAADVAWSLNRIHQPDMGSRWSNIFRAMDRAEEVDRIRSTST